MERPKRRITSRCLEYNNGMLHEEELALRRALQASLTKTSSLLPTPKNITKRTKDDESATKDDKALVGNKKRKKPNGKGVKRKSGDGKNPVQAKRPKKLLVRLIPKAVKTAGKRVVPKEGQKRKVVPRKDNKKLKDKAEKKNKKKNIGVASNVEDENKTTNEGSPRVVRAQRKFAQTNPSSPRSLLLYQSQMQPLKTRAKTEDFLDFLCLRGSDRMPKCLELFNNPCAPLSPLTDEENSTPSKIPTSDQNAQSPQGSGGESSAKRSLNMPSSEELRSVSSSSSHSSVSSPVSTRVQPHAVLPQFTNAKTNYGVLTHIPTPIPYPRPNFSPLTPPGPQGLDAYGLPSTSSSLLPVSSYHPRMSSVAMEMHKVPSCYPDGRQGFYPVTSHSCADMAAGNLQPESSLNTPDQTSCKSSKSPNKGSARGVGGGGGGNKGTLMNPENTSAGVPVVHAGKQTENRLPVCLGFIDEVPLFTPTELEFKNPLRYIESIAPRAAPRGICVVVPPQSWKPGFYLSDEIRFTTKFQYIHRLNNRYSAVELELAAIRKHLKHQGISLAIMPQIAGCELDLPWMSKVVQDYGGLQQIIDRRKWGKVADLLKIPKTAVERSGKLEQFYCKYLLSFDLLSQGEKEKLIDSVKDEQNSYSDTMTKSGQEYMSKGRSMSLSGFQRTAKNLMEHHLRPNAGVNNVEKTYWRITDECQRYVVVHSAQLSNTAFPTTKGTPLSKSKWNLNVLPKVNGSAVRDLTAVEGISSPLVKVEMMLSTEVWKTPPHALYSVDYLHQGSDKIWYSIPSSSEEKYLEVIAAEFDGIADDMQDHMISPVSLMKAGVPVYKVTQEPGQFIIRFPTAYHSSISSGYAVSETVSFAPLSHIQHIKASFQSTIAQPKVEHLFSWESLIVSSVKEELHRNSSEDTLKKLIPELEELKSYEAALRNNLLKCGVNVKTSKNDDSQDKESSGNKSRRRRLDSEEVMNCSECNRHCFLSLVLDQSNNPLCLQHALSNLKEDKNRSHDMSLVVRFDVSELDELLKELKDKLDEVQHKPSPVKRRSNVGSPRQKKTEKGS